MMKDHISGEILYTRAFGNSYYMVVVKSAAERIGSDGDISVIAVRHIFYFKAFQGIRRFISKILFDIILAG